MMSLQANDLSFKYFPKAKKYVFEHFDFQIPKGEVTLLTGKSGSGKSTLAYVLAGLYPENTGVLTSGNVIIDGVDIGTLTADKRVKYVTMMFQNPDLQFCMNHLEQELEFCLENVGIKKEAMSELIDQAIQTLGIRHLRTQSFHTMSGGEKQKCALACIFALKSQYIILDEAFANIDPISAREIIEILCAMNVTVLAIDHNVELWNGKYHNIIRMDGSVSTTFDLKANLHEPGDPVIRTENLVVNAISYPDIEIKKGSITAIVGRSGSGKTTLFKTLIKQHRYKGSIIWDDHELRKVGKKKLFTKCGIVFQNPANQFLALTVFDEVLFSVKRWHKKKPLEWQEAKTLDLLVMFKLDAHKKYAPYMLSQGQQRRLAVLTMIAGAQEILLLDEPTYGQDYENICVMMKLLLEKAKSGLTVLFATHNMAVAENFSHQIIKVGG
jgi:energy-coupling factor transport system ATP-binding protein